MSQSPTPSREELIAHREAGQTREDMAALYGVPLSRVKRWIKDLDIPPPSSEPKEPLTKKRPAMGVPMDPEDGLTLLERAKVRLGTRVGHDYRGYLLDGRPVRVDILIQAAGLKVPDVH